MSTEAAVMGAHDSVKARVNPRVATFLLAFSMFATGASGLVAEYILATVSTYILGNSIEQFSVIIGLMLATMGVASWAQRFVSDRNLIEKFLAIEVSLAVLTSVAPLAIYAAYGTMTSHFALVQYAFVMAIGFLIGFEIPLILRINETYAPKLSRNVAAVFSADYLGGLAGALVWAFVLLRYFPLTEIGVLVAALNFAVAICTFAFFRGVGFTRKKLIPTVAIVATAVWLVMLYGNNRAWAAALEQRLYDDPIVFSETTRYQHLVLTHASWSGMDEYRLYINGNTQFSSVDEHIYHEQLVHPAMNLAARRANVLVLGGGDGMAMREVLKYHDVQSALLVDLDPAMTELARTHPVLAELNDHALTDARVHVLADSVGVVPGAARDVFMETGYMDPQGQPKTDAVASVSIMNVDAFTFIGRVPGEWDVAILDFPDPGAIELSKLYSREFYTRLRSRIAPGGIVVVQATSPYHARAAYLTILRTLEASGFETLPYHDNVPSFGDWGWILAWRPDAPPPDLGAKLTALALDVDTRYLTPEVFRAATVFGKGALAMTGIRVNTLLDPVLHDAYVRQGWRVE